MFGDNLDMTRFDVVLRGYDRRAVDALVTAVEAAGDRERIREVVNERGEPPVVLRGYDRGQVDAWLARRRVAEPGTGAASSPAVPGPELVIVLRGYHMAETDALLVVVGSALAGDDPFRRAAALSAIAATRLPVSLRGYDRKGIDSFLEGAARVLRGR
jgi:hypothetical protein